jgi:ABC-type transporter Mla subunit MlaD
MDQQKQRFRLGLFVVTAGILCAVLILMFGGGSAARLFARQNEYTLAFDNAPGVSVGTPVRRSGVKIGSVTKVELNDQTGKVVVTIAVDRKYTIKKNVVAEISQDLLSRDTTIDLVTDAMPLAPPRPPAGGVKGDVLPAAFEVAAGQPPLGRQPPPAQQPQPVPDDVLPPGSTIPTRPPGGAANALGQFQTVIPALEQALNAIRRSAERLEGAIPQLDLGAREFTALGRAIREAVPEIRRTNDELQAILRNARNAGPELRRTNEELQVTLRNFGAVAERLDNFVSANQDRITKAVDQTTDVLQRISSVLSEENQRNVTATLRAVQTASTNFDNVTRNADEFLKEGTRSARQFQATLAQGERVLRNLDTASDSLNRMFGSVADALGPLGRGGDGGTIQKFFSDPSLFNNLNEAACMITKTMPRLDRILRDVEVFADKIARHPESLGVGGAVRPSAGLKEGPTTPQFHQQHP